MELDHLSYSSISMYLACPESWRRKYIAKEPTVSSPALVFGSAIHATVEHYIQAGGDLLSIWGEKWAGQVEKETNVLWGMESSEQYFNDGIRILSAPEIVAGISAIKPREIERKVELRVPGVRPVIVGYIDVIEADGVPGDFKTSAKSWGSGRAADELQPLFYLAALNQAGMTIKGGLFRHYVFVKTKTPKFERYENAHNMKEIFFLFDLIRRVWEAIEKESFPLNPTGWKCSPAYCDFWAQCRGKYS